LLALKARSLNNPKWHFIISWEEIMKITDLTLWQTFVAVVHERNFARASRVLHTNAPNVTKRISQLESSLGVRLFNRTTRTMSLTVDGEKLLPQVRALIDQAREIEERANETQKLAGLIRVTSLNGIAQRWLAPAIVDFQKLHPAVRFEVLPGDGLMELIQDQVDLALRIQEPTGADVIFREMVVNHLVVCASPAYLKNAKPIRRPRDLHGHPLLFLNVHRELKFHGKGEKLKEFAADRTILCESGTYLTELALLGAGLAVRARYDVNTYLKSGQLVELLAKYPLEYFRKVYLVIPQKRYLSSRVRAFADFLMARRDQLV
jgi:LysR family transcriptional activator of dmlA